MNRDEIFLQELLRFREGINIQTEKPLGLEFKANYNSSAGLVSKGYLVDGLDPTVIAAIQNIYSSYMQPVIVKDENGNDVRQINENNLVTGFSTLEADEPTRDAMIAYAKSRVQSPSGPIYGAQQEVDSFFEEVFKFVDNYSRTYEGQNINEINSLIDVNYFFKNATSILPSLLYKDSINQILSQGTIPNDSLIYSTDGNLINGKTASSLIVGVNNNLLGKDIMAAYQMQGGKNNLEPEGKYSNFVCYLYYLDSKTGPNYTAPSNVYTSKDKNTKFYRGTPKYMGMKDGMAYAATSDTTSGSKGNVEKKIVYFKPLTGIRNFSINGRVIENDSKFLSYIYNSIINDPALAQYWFTPVKEEDTLNTDSGTAIKNISGFTKEEVEQVRNVMSGILKNIAGNNGISMSQFGFAKESLSKSAIVRFREAGETETTGEETADSSDQKTKTVTTRTTSDNGTLAAEITIKLSDEDFEKLISGPKEAPDSNIKDDSSTAAQEEPDQVAATSSEVQA